MILLVSTVSADSHIRKAGDDTGYFLGKTYSGTVSDKDGTCQMQLELNFASDGESFTAQLRSKQTDSAIPKMDGKTKMVDGRIDTTPGLKIGAAGVGKVREYSAFSNKNTASISILQIVEGGFYTDSGRTAKGQFYFWDFSSGYYSCSGTFSVERGPVAK